MLKFMFRAICAVIAIFTLIHSASALVGVVDHQDEFPYVVKLSTEFRGNHRSSCSGVVHGYILSTAAHCLYDSSGTALRVTVSYVDTLGVQQTASSKAIYVPRKYIEDDPKYHNSYEGAPHDIGYVVLDKDVVVAGYLHWGLELLRDDSFGPGACNYKSDCSNWWNGDIHNNKVFSDNLRKVLGADLSKVKVRVVGYGNYRCDDYNAREENCVSDGQRRYTELTLKPNLAQPGAPWIWCTGQNAMGVNPVQHGDSGGPVFIQALDGRWLYVGYTSRGNNDDGCASGMFNDLQLWRQAMEANGGWSARKTSESDVYDDVNAWEVTVARQALDEWVRVQSAPADVAINSQALLYVMPDIADEDQKIAFYRTKTGFPNIVASRKAFFDRWPVRKFWLSDISTQCVNTDTMDYCWDRAVVRSHFENANGEGVDGQFRLSLHVVMPMFSTNSIVTLSFLPTIDDEHCGPLVGDQVPPGLDCQEPRPYWDYKGSNVRLAASGTKREFFFQVPDDSEAQLGVRAGTLLFSGRRSGKTYSGTAYAFKKGCTPAPYAVSGTVSDDDRWVRLQGQKPVFDARCNSTATEPEWLDLMYEADE